MMWFVERLSALTVAVLVGGCSGPAAPKPAPAMARPAATQAPAAAATATPAPAQASDVPLLVAGDHHTCAGTDDGGLECWGAGDAGQLGDGRYRDRSAPVRVLYVRKAALAAAGADHTCAQTAQGQLYCWGMSIGGWSERGIHSSSPLPMRMPFGPFSALAAGRRFTCGLAASRKVTCFGASGYQSWSLTADEFTDSDDIAAAGDLLCATMRGTQRCFRVDPAISRSGLRLPGGPGLRPVDAGIERSPVPVPDGIRPAGPVVRGLAHACAHTPAGIRCWGDNSRGQLADMRPLSAPSSWARVSDLDALAITADVEQFCAVTRSGAVVCWGKESRERPATTQLRTRTGFAPASAISADAEGSALCVVLRDGGVQCEIRERGDRETSATPTRLPRVAGAVEVGANADSICVVDGKRRVHCRELRDEKAAFERVPGLPAIASMHMLGTRACGLDRRQRLWCWGSGYARAKRTRFVRRLCPDGPHYHKLYDVPLGDRCRHSRQSPLVGVRGLIFTGGTEAMPLFWAFTDKGGLFAYVDTDDGGSLARRRKGRQRRFLGHIEPFPLPADTVEIVGSRAIGCAITAGSSTHCWGDPFGPLPTPVTLPTLPVELAASMYQVCLRSASGSVHCLSLD